MERIFDYYFMAKKLPIVKEFIHQFMVVPSDDGISNVIPTVDTIPDYHRFQDDLLTLMANYGISGTIYTVEEDNPWDITQYDLDPDADGAGRLCIRKAEIAFPDEPDDIVEIELENGDE